MKKISIILIGISLINVGCKKFLDLKPTSSGTVSTYYTDSNTIVAGVNGIYDGLQQSGEYGSGYIRLMEVRGQDNVTDGNPSGGGGVNYSISAFGDEPSNTTTTNVWRHTYNTIARCNIVLEKAQELNKQNLPVYNEAIGQAYFIRALHYFHLVRLFGKVPIFLTIKDGFTDVQRQAKRAEISAVYQQIESDLEKAVASLPLSWNVANAGRATQFAARTLLGKVYIYQKKWQEAITVLQPVYDEIFKPSGNIITTVASSTTFPNGIRSSKDIIFVAYFSGTPTGEAVARTARYQNADNGFINIMTKATFETGDNRRGLFTVSGGNGNNMPVKFNNTNGASGSNISGDFPILRAAEALLLYAEAGNEVAYVTDSATMPWRALNRVRANAGLARRASTLLPDQAKFRAEVYKQRYLELGLEGDRWFDVVRTEQIDTMRNNASSPYYNVPLHRKLYPIPQAQVENVSDKTGWQNEGY